ncbi:MAG: leucyl aminopeptidase [Deltaproteobacteria bacterium]|nr:leucyl aminopeptidase [Deltaproteobacteria bacterium]
MNLLVRIASMPKIETPCLVTAAFEGETAAPRLAGISRLAGGGLEAALRQQEFSGKKLETLLLHLGEACPCRRLLLVGLGKREEVSLEKLRQGIGAAAGVLKGKRIEALAVDFGSFRSAGNHERETAEALAEGLLLADYRFSRFLTENREELPVPLRQALFCLEEGSHLAPVEAGIAAAVAIGAGVALARNLVNEPGNVKSPAWLAGQARTLAEENGLHCTILEKADLVHEGMGALLGVAQGSSREPCLIVLEYDGAAPDQAPLVLVGKGVVFDSGGISLKPAEHMDTMKMDMAGGAAVLGTLLAASRLRLPRRVVGIIPVVENLPSGTAIRPGDILTSLSGKTIEVLNTDAEGRLILADALSYAKRFEPECVIDLATLTGACIVALGHQAAAVLGNDDELIGELIACGEASGERLWQLPLWDDYSELIKSEVADVKNSAGRPAGTITGAAFLRKFAPEEHWAHIDIAGTAWEEQGRPCHPKGGTGFGVRLLMRFLRQPAAP